MGRIQLSIVYILFSSCFFAFIGWADINHENDLLVGDRAAGLGGAFCAFSDDPTGVFYNPGGLAFAKEDGLSASANAYAKKTITYKKAFIKQDFTFRSAGLVPAFFGNLKRLGDKPDGWVAAFGIYSPSSEIVDQEDDVSDIPEYKMKRVYSKLKGESSQTYVTGALSKRLSPEFGVGVSLSYVRVESVKQQYLKLALGPISSDTNGSDHYINITQNESSAQRASIIESGFGLRYMPLSTLSFGLTVKAGVPVSDKSDTSTEVTVMRTRGDGTPVSEDDVDTQAEAKYTDVSQKESNRHAFGKWPLRIRMGFALMPKSGLTWTGDVMYVQSVPATSQIDKRKAIVNFATGLEYLITNNVPIRFGLFTNNDSTPKVNEASMSTEQIDYLGASIFTGLTLESSRFSAGCIYQSGKGRSKVISIGDLKPMQDVKAESIVVAFGVSSTL